MPFGEHRTKKDNFITKNSHFICFCSEQKQIKSLFWLGWNGCFCYKVIFSSMFLK